MEPTQIQHEKTLEQSKILVLENALTLAVKLIKKLNALNAQESTSSLMVDEFVRVSESLLEKK